MRTTTVVETDQFYHYFAPLEEELRKEQRIGPNGYPAFKYIGSAEIVDLQGEVIDKGYHTVQFVSNALVNRIARPSVA